MELEHVRTGATSKQDAKDTEKCVETAYIAEDIGSHNKSKEERALVLKADAVIAPLCALLYLVSYLDRNSLGNAKVLGMQTDLGLSSTQWSNCLSLFYVGYIVVMMPGNILLGKLSPNRQLGSTAFIFGALLIAMSAAQSYATVLALRIMIGAAQGFMQGLTLYCSLWYKRDEVGTRNAFMYGSATISGAFSGLISYGVGETLTTSTTSRASWRWLFIIEGSLAMGVGLAIWILLPLAPDKLKHNHWLFTSEEVDMAKARSSSYNTKGFSIDVKQISSALSDPKSWAFAIINGALGLGVSSLGSFMPTFINELGYSAETTQLFTIIPYACAAMSFPISIFSDRINRKGPFLIATMSLICIGYIILLCPVSAAGSIVATCLVTTGVYPSVIILQSWIVVNTAGYTKRASTWAMAEIFGQSLSIMGSYIYNTPPRFVKGHAIVLSLMLLGIVMSTFLLWWMAHANRKKDAELSKYVSKGRVHPHKTRSLEEELDFHVDFKYIL